MGCGCACPPGLLADPLRAARPGSKPATRGDRDRGFQGPQGARGLAESRLLQGAAGGCETAGWLKRAEEAGMLDREIEQELHPGRTEVGRSGLAGAHRSSSDRGTAGASPSRSSNRPARTSRRLPCPTWKASRISPRSSATRSTRSRFGPAANPSSPYPSWQRTIRSGGRVAFG